jgi:hypothetical protein
MGAGEKKIAIKRKVSNAPEIKMKTPQMQQCRRDGQLNAPQ